jgi:hypothetical protein
VASQDNPAGRLHELLSRYRTVASNDASLPVHSVWMAVLDVDETELPAALCEVASLVSAIELEAFRTDRAELKNLLEHYRRAWTLPILSSDMHPRQMPGPGPGYVDENALASLAVVSMLLESSSQVRVPDPAQVEALKQQIVAALDEVLRAQDLPGEIRMVVVARLHDIIWALDHLLVSGPDGVVAAIERLIGAIVLQNPDPEEAEKSSTFGHVFHVIRFAWELFRKGPEISRAIEGWSNVVASLPSGTPSS